MLTSHPAACDESPQITRVVPHTGRAKNIVLPLRTRVKITEWMIQEVSRNGSEDRIATKTISQFPQHFSGTSSAMCMRAKRLWDDRVNLISTTPKRGDRSSAQMTVLRVSARGGVKRAMVKARSGRGRKRSKWGDALQADLLEEFTRMRRIGVKFSSKTLVYLAKHLVDNSDKEDYNRGTIVSSTATYSGKTTTTEKHITDLITARWIQVFMSRYDIVLRTQCGKLQISPKSQEQIERRVSFFLGCVARELSSGLLNECDVENADETHFIINVDNGKTLGFKGDVEVRYADVVSGGEGMTMMVRISGGSQAVVENPFMIFKNQNCSYPIRGVSDDVPGVSYRTGAKGWIDRRVMVEWLCEKRAISPLGGGRRRVLFMDNCGGHAVTEEQTAALKEINTEIRFFPPNSTHLIQPADAFVIQKIKAAWSARWEKHKMRLLSEVCSDTYGTNSGRLPNPGKRFFLKLAADSVRDVNQQRDEMGITYARKSMIRCGLAKSGNGLWEKCQLFPHLQNIIAKFRENFDGLDPDSAITSN